MTASRQRRTSLGALTMGFLLIMGLVAPAAVADLPFRGTSGDANDPYAYENYMFLDPAPPAADPTQTTSPQYPPNDLGDDIWKYDHRTACELYDPPSPPTPEDPDGSPGDPQWGNCDPATRANPEEQFGVTGASVSRAWETSTGRPDVIIAVHDSGIDWTGSGKRSEMLDVVPKTWLNRAELPLPNWGSPHPQDPYDRNADGFFNIRDYCPDWEERNDCGGSGDSRVRGGAGTPDTDLNGNGVIDPEDLIFLFSDGFDGVGANNDGNGYIDDFVGWDSYEDDNDPFDEVHYGHGTGEAADSTGEADNGRGQAGTCPNCMVMHMRVGDSFIADVNDAAEGMLYAVDNGASVLQSALGTLNNSRLAQEAINYAYRRGAVLIASAADESAGHHNQPSVLEHAVTMNSIGEPQHLSALGEGPIHDEENIGQHLPWLPGAPPPSYLEFRGCTNYGAYITAAVPSNSCSSEAVGRSAGMAGLIYATARNEVAKGNLQDYGTLDGAGGVSAGRGVSAEEVDQLIATTTDDIHFSPGYTAQPKYGDSERYPATEGWDPFFGYGRVNARRMLKVITAGKIPPEADITSPKWFEIVDSSGDAALPIQGRVAALRYPNFSYKIEWGVWSWRDANSAPAYTSAGVTYPGSTDRTGQYSGLLATISKQAIKDELAAANSIYGPTGRTNGPGVDPATGRGDHENRQIPDKFSIIVRVEVTAKDAEGNSIQGFTSEDDPNQDASAPLVGVGTKNFFFHDDPALFAGFPKDLQGDGAAAPRFADIDDDGRDEMIVATSNGLIHAYNADGTEVEGWPVHTTSAGMHTGTPWYGSGEITTPIYSAVLRSPAVGDLDRDGDLEVVSGDFQGRIWAWDSDGDVLPGFPRRSNPSYSAPQRPDREANFYDAHPELVPGRYPGPDGDFTTPDPLPNDPDLVPDLVNRHDELNRVIWWTLASPTLGNIDPTDDDLEIIAGAADRHMYAFHSDGTPVTGWPLMLRDPARLDGFDPDTHEVTHNDDDEQFYGAKVVVSPAVGNVDQDGSGSLEILATVNEQYEETPNTDDQIAPVLAAASKVGNDRLYAIYPDGGAHPAGGPDIATHPNEQAFIPGWPAKIASYTLELLPVVGNGPDGAPILGEVMSGNDSLEIGIFGTAGPAYVLDKTGHSIYGQEGGKDRTLRTNAYGANSNSPDAPAIPAVGGPIFTTLEDGDLSLAAPSAGLGKLLDVILPEDQLMSDNHVSVWELQTGDRQQKEAFPREVNDLQFLTTPASADIDGDRIDEVLEGSAYNDLHAFSFVGGEPGLQTLAANGWPKFTGGWSVAPPAVGDVNGDGLRDVAHVIREGRLFLWRSNGASVCDPATWPEFGHDNWNTNNVETDAARPRTITDLDYSVVGDDVVIQWTAPGDDGPCGTAERYDLRRSDAPITTDNFTSAEDVGGEPQPVQGGQSQSMTVPRPVCDAYFSLRSFDADPSSDTPAHPANVSAASNSLLVAGSAPEECNPKATSLFFKSGLRGQITDDKTLAARLTSPDGPVAGRTLEFSFQGRQSTATTNGNGVARTTVRVRRPAGATRVTVEFTGVSGLQPSSLTRTFRVLRDDTAMRLFVRKDDDGRGFIARARLWELDRDRTLRGKRVRFYLNDELIGSRTTNRAGIAALRSPRRRLRRGDVVTALFRKTARYRPVEVSFTFRGRNGA